MFKVFVFAVVIFLAILGLSELLHRLWMLLLRPEKTKNYLVTVINNTFPGEQILATLEELRWRSDGTKILIGIDAGLSDESVNICKAFERENSDFYLCKPEEIWSEIKKRS